MTAPEIAQPDALDALIAEMRVYILEGVADGVQIRRWADRLAALRAAQQEPPQPCRTCGGSGFIAQKQFIDDGYGEVDSCPTCGILPAPPGPPAPEAP